MIVLFPYKNGDSLVMLGNLIDEDLTYEQLQIEVREFAEENDLVASDSPAVTSSLSSAKHTNAEGERTDDFNNVIPDGLPDNAKKQMIATMFLSEYEDADGNIIPTLDLYPPKFETPMLKVWGNSYDGDNPEVEEFAPYLALLRTVDPEAELNADVLRFNGEEFERSPKQAPKLTAGEPHPKTLNPENWFSVWITETKKPSTKSTTGYRMDRKIYMVNPFEEYEQRSRIPVFNA